jgi:hypothetical protein
MAKRSRKPNGDWACRTQEVQAARQGGCHTYADLDYMRSLPGPDGDILRMIYGKDDKKFSQIIEHDLRREQQAKLHVFVHKHRPPSSGLRRPPLRRLHGSGHQHRPPTCSTKVNRQREAAKLLLSDV